MNNFDKQIFYWAHMLDEAMAVDGIAVEVIDDPDKIRFFLPKVLNIVIKTYAAIGGYYGNTDLNRLIRTISMIKLVRANKGGIAACAFYRNVNGSFKIQAYGNDDTQHGKDGVKAIIKSDVESYSNWVWGEVSGKVEKYFKKYEGYPLPNELVAEVLEKNPNSILLSNDGFHYKRKIGNNGTATEKVIYGFKDAATMKKAMDTADYESRRQMFNMSLIKESDDSNNEIPEALSFDGACSFVNQLSDLYDEEQLDQLTPGLSSLLDTSIKVLHANINNAKWVKMTLDNAKFLRSHISEIKPFKHNF